MSWHLEVDGMIACILILMVFALIYPGRVDAAGVMPAQGVKWQVPASIQPNFNLSHPRVIYNEADVARARVNAANWGSTVLSSVVSQFSGFNLTDEQIRSLMPKPYSYYMYLDNFKTCPDGSLMKWAGLSNPGKVICGGKMFPDATHPDNGQGWKDPSGVIYYFVARWNGAYVEYLTKFLEPLALAYSLTGKQEYAHKAAVILDALATIYPTATEGPLDYPGLRPGLEGGRLERPYYQAARVLLQYVNTADLIWNSGELDKPSATNPGISTRDNIVYNMFLNGADYCYREVYNGSSLLNGTADNNKAILAVGSLLGIDKYVDWAVNGQSSFGAMLTNNINRDGVYSETTTNYANYTRTIYMEIAELYYKLRTPNYPSGINMFDNPRFVAFYKDSRETLFLAGHIPYYGDSSIDNSTIIKKPLEEDAAKQLLRFAVRASDEEKSAEYWRVVTSITSPKVAAMDLWGLFNVSALPNVTDTVPQTVRPSEIAGGTGIAVLRSGADRGVFLRYGTTLNHGHYDELSMLFYNSGQELSFDPGYSDAHYRVGWTQQTVSHITGLVNEKRQLSGKSAGGSLNFFTTTQGYSAVEACDPAAYDLEKVSVYCRTLALTDTAPKKSYIVDIFRIDGGNKRDYSFHSKGTSFTTTGLALGAAQPGSVASTQYTWHNQIGQDMKIISYRNQDFYWNPMGNGYGFLGNPRKATTDDVWSATWSGSGSKVRLSMLPSEGREVIVADAPSPMGALKYVLARDTGSEISQYAAVIDMTTDNFQISAIEALKTTVITEAEVAPIAFALTINNPDLPLVTAKAVVKDIYLSSVSGLFQATAGDKLLTTDADMAMVRMYDSEPVELHVTKGTSLSVGDLSIKGFPATYEGKIESVDYANSSILISSNEALTEGIIGEYILVSADEYSHNSPYRIKEVTKEGEYYRLKLETDWFELAIGAIDGTPKGNVLPNSISLPYARNVSRGGISSYFKGKLVVNNSGAQTLIKTVQEDQSGLVVDSIAGFKYGDHLVIYDIKAGDSFTIAVSVHLAKIDDITYELKSPQPVWLTVPAKYQDCVYLETGAGEYILAQQANKGGQKVFLITPGHVIFGNAAVIKVDTINQADGSAPAITTKLSDAGNGQPIEGAKMVTVINGTTVPFTETSPGAYKLYLPSDMLAGEYNLRITASKENLGIKPLTVEFSAIADWKIIADDVLAVPLGANQAEIKAAVLTGDQPARDIEMTAHINEQVVPMVAVGNGVYTAFVTATSEEDQVVLRARQTNGFSRQVTLPVTFKGGQIVLPGSEVRVKAGSPLTINVSFKGGNGEILKGSAIPKAVIVLGIFNTASFSDEDGDGVATAVITAPTNPGNNEAYIMADGCVNTTLIVVVEE